MKKVWWFVIFTSALVLGSQEAQKRGDTVSLQNKGPVTQASTDFAILKLMTATSPIVYPKQSPFDLFSDACKTDMKEQCDFSNPANGISCNFIKTCYVVGMPSDYAIHIFSKTTSGDMPENPNLPPGSKQMANMGRFHAIFLPFEPDYDTYTTLNPKVAPLFFTDDLGGCDMFVATATNKGDKPIVFHTNRNSILDPEQNLRTKGQSVDNILARSYSGYKVVARVYWTSLKPDEKENIDKYLRKEYTPGHLGITLLPYNNQDGLPVGHVEKEQPFSFIGHYKDQKVWKFILKGRTSGIILHEFSVSAAALGVVVDIKRNRVN